MKIRFLFLALIMAISGIFFSCRKTQETAVKDAPSHETTQPDAREEQYANALRQIRQGNYEQAYDLLQKLTGYKDSEDYLRRFRFSYDKIIESSDGSTTVTEFTYNEKGNMTQKVEIGPDGYTYNYQYIYDGKGNLIELLEDDCKTEYTYDPQGILIKTIYKNKYYSSTVEYIYDGNGKRIKELLSNSDGEFSTMEYSYDDHGNLIKKLYNGAYESNVTEYTYDSEGNLSKEVASYSTGENIVTEYTYDRRRNVTKENVSLPDSEYSRTTEYTYDSKGNVIKKVSESSNGNISSTDYSYHGEHIFYIA